MKYQFRVKKSERGVRLQAFLHKMLENQSHKKIKEAIDKKDVFVNGKNVFIANWNLKPNDRVEFRASDSPATLELNRYQFVQVIFEDDYLLATNKPPHVDYDSFVAQVNAYLKRMKPRGFYPYLGQMHRLDKETSGLLLFTKKKAANTLADQFRNRTIRKEYVAVVMGAIPVEHEVIEERLEKKKLPGGRKVSVSKEGKASRTEYWVKERYEEATLLRILLGTGRTHQIRVHLSERGFPVWGDKLYGPVQVGLTKSLRDQKINRHALHAHRLELQHPITHAKMKLMAPIPKDMEALIDYFRLKS